MASGIPKQTSVLPLSRDQTDCAAYALDGLGDDISKSIAYTTSNPACTAASAGDLACPLCAVQYMQQGMCLPGRYALLSVRCHTCICFSMMIAYILVWVPILASSSVSALIMSCNVCLDEHMPGPTDKLVTC